MTQPAVNMTELDGALGILPPSAGALLAIVGVSNDGPVDTPAAYARVSDVVADFGRGPLVEAAAYAITRFGRPVLVVRTGDTTAGSLTAAVLTGSGTAVPSVASSPKPCDDFEFYLEVITGGALGTAGITFKWSLDGGRTMSAETALGTALTYEFADTGEVDGTGVEVTLGLAAATLVAGDVITFSGTAAMWNAAEIGTALTALRKSAQLWAIVEIVGAMDATLFAAVETAVAGMAAYGKDRMYIGHARMPGVGESEATYLAALVAIYGSLSTLYGAVCAGSAKMISGVSGRQYRRPPSFWVAPKHAVVSEEINLANVKVGRMDAVIITDSVGNPDDHDESTNPGLDDARFLVLRTWEGRPGVYINRPRILSTPTSDYQLIPHRRVMNLAKTVIRSYLEERVNEEILVDRTTGYILEEEALEIEAGANAALRGSLLAKPKASAAAFVLSRTDNLLGTKTITCTCRVVPLAYPEFIEVEIGFENPAIQARGV
jgi:hypothetical protein